MRFRNIVLALLLGSTTLSLAGCNTVRGLAADIDSVGRAGERAID
ncbi:hypothetical protein [Aurantiacibacter gangjinensis]|nr:hypothetical protein [Aurantiacibacter gangjinensis]APE29207.1 hypothetical protein BMF35_a2378 [Aurantiacibacter gangjinensis]